MKEIIEYLGQNVCIPTSGMCLIKSINYLSDKQFTETYRGLIRKKRCRSGVMTSARIEPFCKIYDMNNGCFDGKRINP